MPGAPSCSLLLQAPTAGRRPFGFAALTDLALDLAQKSANCDLPRRNELDGRGAWSEEAVAEFTRFFLMVSIDHVSFMESPLQPDRLRSSILVWAEEEIRLGELPTKSGSILERCSIVESCPRRRRLRLRRRRKAGPANCVRPAR